MTTTTSLVLSYKTRTIISILSHISNRVGVQTVTLLKATTLQSVSSLKMPTGHFLNARPLTASVSISPSKKISGRPFLIKNQQTILMPKASNINNPDPRAGKLKNRLSFEAGKQCIQFIEAIVRSMDAAQEYILCLTITILMCFILWFCSSELISSASFIASADSSIS